LGVVVPFERAAEELEQIQLPPGAEGVVGAAVIKGYAHSPGLRDGDVIMWGAHSQNIQESVRERICMLPDGRVVLRAIKKGSKNGRWHLVPGLDTDPHSVHTLNDVEVLSTAPVLWTRFAT